MNQNQTPPKPSSTNAYYPQTNLLSAKHNIHNSERTISAIIEFPKPKQEFMGTPLTPQVEHIPFLQNCKLEFCLKEKEIQNEDKSFLNSKTENKSNLLEKSFKLEPFIPFSIECASSGLKLESEDSGMRILNRNLLIQENDNIAKTIEMEHFKEKEQNVCVHLLNKEETDDGYTFSENNVKITKHFWYKKELWLGIEQMEKEKWNELGFYRNALCKAIIPGKLNDYYMQHVKK